MIMRCTGHGRQSQDWWRKVRTAWDSVLANIPGGATRRLEQQ